MIETLSAALQKILLMKQTNNYDGASAELNVTAKKLIGLELEHIRTFTDDRIIELTLLEKDTAAVKLYVTGLLLKEDASIAYAGGSTDKSTDLYLKSASLLLEAYLQDNRPVYSDHAFLIEESANKLNGFNLPEVISQKLLVYYERTGQFGKAEDTLFELIEAYPAHINEGILFYERLLKKNDDELIKGNLPRKEVTESISLLKNKLIY